MGFLGGSSQSTSSIVSTIDFSPVIQFGEDQNSTQDKINRQEATVSPEQRDEGFAPSLSASAGVALAPGSSAMGGSASSGDYEDDTQPIETEAPLSIGSNPLENINTSYLLIGGGVLVLAYLFKSKKKKKK